MNEFMNYMMYEYDWQLFAAFSIAMAMTLAMGVGVGYLRWGGQKM